MTSPSKSMRFAGWSLIPFPLTRVNEACATTIQCRFRVHRAMKELQRQRQAAIAIQSVIRQRNSAHGLIQAMIIFRIFSVKCWAKCRETQATKIQRSFRASQYRTEQKKRARIVLQSFCRLVLAKKLLHQALLAKAILETEMQLVFEVQTIAAVVIQTAVRVSLAKDEYERRMVESALTGTEEENALLIQTAFVRPMLAKKHVEILRSYRYIENAAITIQTAVRVMRAKRVLSGRQRDLFLKHVVDDFMRESRDLAVEFHAKHTASPWRKALYDVQERLSGMTRFVGETRIVVAKDVANSIDKVPGMGRLIRFLVINLVVFGLLRSARRRSRTRAAAPQDYRPIYYDNMKSVELMMV
eukprot:CAMPEP_0194033750 /NCGR_PEP_ID=MMETSP0009_2-20130614/6306_1 /TAXON_ID=210454 /ORGANISM="Grammatophora oceanica, Strain CCMP 410" /LENGTH=356 /DNA_ID=CAMNT_0038674469 /DNA_START=227 /DNA_END=1297 /DNA_ORIENTATION=+